jgi:hypothetical protein
VLEVDLKQGTGSQQVHFRIRRTFKGEKQGRWSGGFSWTGTDHHFKTGTRVIVYASERNGIWRTACNRTRTYDESDIEALKEEVTQLERCGARTK